MLKTLVIVTSQLCFTSDHITPDTQYLLSNEHRTSPPSHLDTLDNKSNMNVNMNHAIRLFSEGEDYQHDVQIYLGNNYRYDVEAEIIITTKDGYGSDEYGYRERHEERHEFTQKLKNRDQWDQLGKAIGCNAYTYKLKLSKRKVERDDEEPLHRVNRISDEEYGCLQIFYRGVELNSSIKDLTLDMDLFPDNEVLPTFNLVNAQFKESLEVLNLYGDDYMNDYHSFMISSVLETTSLEHFRMMSKSPSTTSSESAFRRIVLACTNVKELDVRCRIISRFTALGDLLRNPTSILTELIMTDDTNLLDNLPTFLAGLAGNVTLKKLSMAKSSKVARSLIAKLLCDNTSIEHIYNSNHTLEEVSDLNWWSQMAISDAQSTTLLLQNLLDLNKNTNKEEVIRTKIAQYYFVGDFDVSPFVNMNTSALPNVLEMIGGNANNCQSAIVRLLTSIPELCNVSSRVMTGYVGNINRDAIRTAMIKKIDSIIDSSKYPDRYITELSKGVQDLVNGIVSKRNNEVPGESGENDERACDLPGDECDCVEPSAKKTKKALKANKYLGI